MKSLYTSRQEKLSFFLLILYAAFVFMFDGDESNVRLIHLAYGVLVLYYFYCCRSIRIFKISSFLIAYLAFGALSIIWAEGRGTAFSRTKGVFLILAVYLLMTTYYMHIRNALPLLAAIVAGSLALTIYMFSLYGLSGILSALQSGGTRIGDLINNVNGVGNALSIGAVAVIGIAFFYHKRIFLALLIPMLAALLATGSRTATISLIVGILAVILCTIRNNRNSLRRFLQIFFILIIMMGVWLVIRNLPATQELAKRIENIFVILSGEQSTLKESSTQGRLELIKLGWNLFLKKPILGNGIGCAGYSFLESKGHVMYLHNNYIEILASGGVIGFVLYYSPYLIIFNSLKKRIFRFREDDPIVLVSFVMLVAKLVGHFGSVVYYSKIEYLLLALWTTVIYIPKDTPNNAYE